MTRKTRATKPTRTYWLRLEPETARKALALAKRKRWSRATLMTVAVEQYVAREASQS